MGQQCKFPLSSGKSLLFFIRRFSLTDLKQSKTTIRRRTIIKLFYIMTHTKKYEAKQIDTTDAGNFENVNSCKEGYSYAIIEEWSNGNEKYSDVSCWKIHPDGTFEFFEDCDTCDCIYVCNGTFDKSKYDNFVCQMLNLETDWQNELVEDKSTEDGTCGSNGKYYRILEWIKQR